MKCTWNLPFKGSCDPPWATLKTIGNGLKNLLKLQKQPPKMPLKPFGTPYFGLSRSLTPTQMPKSKTWSGELSLTHSFECQRCQVTKNHRPTKKRIHSFDLCDFFDSEFMHWTMLSDYMAHWTWLEQFANHGTGKKLEKVKWVSKITSLYQCMWYKRKL